jgi:hypothetical protein
MEPVAPEGETFDRVLQRVKDGQCLTCDAKPKQLRRGLCDTCEKKFRAMKKRVRPAKLRKAWVERQIRAGKVLDAYQIRQLLNPNPFAEV